MVAVRSDAEAVNEKECRQWLLLFLGVSHVVSTADAEYVTLTPLVKGINPHALPHVEENKIQQFLSQKVLEKLH